MKHPNTIEAASHPLSRLDESDLPLPEVFRRACEVAVESLHVERAGIWLVVNGDQALRCVNLFERTPRKHSKGATLAVGESPAFLRAIVTSPLLAIESVRTDPRTADISRTYFAPLGIASTLCAPLIRDGRLIGVAFCEQVGSARTWADADRSFALQLSERLVERMRSAEGALKSGSPRTQFVVAPPTVPASVRLAHELQDLMAEIEVLARSSAKSGIPERFRRIAEAAARSNGIIRKLFESRDETAEHETLRERAPDDDTDEHPALPANAAHRT